MLFVFILLSFLLDLFSLMSVDINGFLYELLTVQLRMQFDMRIQSGTHTSDACMQSNVHTINVSVSYIGFVICRLLFKTDDLNPAPSF